VAVEVVLASNSSNREWGVKTSRKVHMVSRMGTARIRDKGDRWAMGNSSSNKELLDKDRKIQYILMSDRWCPVRRCQQAHNPVDHRVNSTWLTGWDLVRVEVLDLDLVPRG